MKVYWSKLPERVQKKLIEYYVEGVTATAAGNVVGVNKNTATLFNHKLRMVIAEKLEETNPFEGEIEVDESYFGGKR